MYIEFNYRFYVLFQEHKYDPQTQQLSGFAKNISKTFCYMQKISGNVLQNLSNLMIFTLSKISFKH